MKKSLLLAFVVFSIIFIGGCASVNEELKANDTDKDALYGQALLELPNSTNDLDTRFNHLQNLINMISSGEQELKMVHFAGIKLELDYLQISGFNQGEINRLWDEFKKTFLEVEKGVVEENYSRLSLNDRYFSLNNKIEKVSTGESELSVSHYLQLDKGINNLVRDGYISSRVTELRAQLSAAVIAELESGIINYGVSVEELVGEPEEVKMPEPLPELKPPEPKPEVGLRTHVVRVIDGGFDRKTLQIGVGETVIWKNVREGHYTIALLLGNKECRDIKSGFFNSGVSYNWTFNDVGTCFVSDGIFTTQAMKVIVY